MIKQVQIIICSAAASRVATVALMILANEFLPTHDATGVHKFRPTVFPAPSSRGSGGGGVLAAFTRWDSAWFLSIADSGYPYSPEQHYDCRRRSNSRGVVDCAGTERAWGGEEYVSATGHEEEREEECRRDIPLEEQAHAFFPLYPLTVRWTAASIRAVTPQAVSVGKTDSLILAAVLVSNACFVAAAVLLYYLGTVVTGDSFLAFRGALAFCATPASVFFSTAYTESLFSALTFAGLLVLFSEGRRRRRRNGPSGERSGMEGGCGAVGSGTQINCAWSGALSSWVAAVLLSLATLTRSNGIAAAGVLVLEKLRWMADEYSVSSNNFKHRAKLNGGEEIITRPAATSNDKHGQGKVDDSRGVSKRGVPVTWARLAACAIFTAFQAILVAAPYVLVQVYAYRKFCKGGETPWGSDAAGKEYDGDDTILQQHLQHLHPWCTWQVPSVYAHVQSAYWGVGALKYYQWKQIPNFLLAAPTLLLTVCGVVQFFSAQLQGLTQERRAEFGPSVRQAGRVDWVRRLVMLSPPWLERLADSFFGPSRLPNPASQSFEHSGAAALVLQWGFLGLFAALCMNVQVRHTFSHSRKIVHKTSALLFFFWAGGSKLDILIVLALYRDCCSPGLSCFFVHSFRRLLSSEPSSVCYVRTFAVSMEIHTAEQLIMQH